MSIYSPHISLHYPHMSDRSVVLQIHVDISHYYIGLIGLYELS